MTQNQQTGTTRPVDDLFLFKHLIENSSEAVGISTPEGIHYYQNKAFDRLFGSIGDDPPENLYVEKELGRHIFKTIIRGGSWQGEVKMFKKDESVMDVFLRADAIRNQDGRIIGLVGLHSDITERKRIEEALRESSERFEAIIANTPDHIVIQDKELRYTLVVNPQLGLTEQEMLGKKDYDFLASDEADRLTRVKKHVMETGVAEQCQISLRSRTAGIEIFEGSLMPRFDALGQVEGLIGYFRNVTERKRVEEALRHSEERYRSLVEISPEALLVNRNDRIAFVNPAALQLFGATEKEQLIGKTPYDVFHPDYHDLIRDRIRQLRAGTPVLMAEERIVKLDSTAVDVEVVATAFTDNEGLAIQVLLHDITERKRAENEIKLALAEKTVLLKEIHHRVKNNMQVISSLLEMQADVVNSPELSEIFKDLQGRVRSMSIVHQKLYQSESLSKIDFAEYAESLLITIWKSHRCDVKLTLQLSPMLLPVDKAIPLGLILNELVTNALKHAFKGRFKGEVRVALYPDTGERMCLKVSDNGSGLPEGFDWASSPSLGLHLIRILSAQLNGTAEVDSSQGNSFIICFKAD